MEIIKDIKNKLWTEEEDQFLKDNYENGYMSDIIEKLDRTIAAVRSRGRKLGLKRSFNDHINKKIELNHNFFNKPNILNSYWAGFIAADGNLHSSRNVLTICLAKTDRKLLERFAEDINFNGTLYNTKNKLNGKILHKVRIEVSSKKIKEDLIKNYNIFPKKSLTLEPPENLNLVQSLSFIKGNLDGDGSIINTKSKGKRQCRIQFLGTKSLLLWIENILKNNLNLKGNPQVNKTPYNMYELRFNGIDAKEIHKILSRVISPSLDRKWNKIKHGIIIIKEDWQKYGGWFGGSFYPAAFITDDFEICHKIHKKGEVWPPHFHKIATEYNYLIKGNMIIKGEKLVEGDVFIIQSGEIADPTFQTDCTLTVVKIPSIIGDKYET